MDEGVFVARMITSLASLTPCDRYCPNQLTLVTWNIDGLCEEDISRRTQAVIDTLRELNADIVFLQEVIHQTFEQIQTELTNYECLPACTPDVAYFNATLLRRGRVDLDRHRVVDFESLMGRHVLIVEVKYFDKGN